MARAATESDGRPEVAQEDGRTVLLVDGVVQSVRVVEGEPDGYWSAMMPAVKPRQALVLGLGAGTIVQLLWRRFGPVPITAVDDNPRVIDLARRHFGLDEHEIDIQLGDAYAFARGSQERYDYICVDLFRGGQQLRGLFARPFLRDLKRLSTPGGEIALNLFDSKRLPHSLQRLGRVLTIRAVIRVERNVVVLAGVR